MPVKESDFPALTAQLLREYRLDPVRFIQEQCVIKNAHLGDRVWDRPVLYPLQ